MERIRRALARDLIREIRGLDASLADIAARMTAAPDDYGSRLLDVDGIGPGLGARLIGRTGRALSFPTADAFATYAGATPLMSEVGDRWMLVYLGQPLALETGVAPV